MYRVCTSEGDSDDVFQPEIIMDFIQLIIYQLWYLIEKIKIGVTGKFRERNLKVYLNTEVGDLIFGEEDCLETLNPKMVSPVINMILLHVNLTENLLHLELHV